MQIVLYVDMVILLSKFQKFHKNVLIFVNFFCLAVLNLNKCTMKNYIKVYRHHKLVNRLTSIVRKAV